VSRRPTYPIDSVDSALRLLQILHRDGELRVTSAARELGVAPSTAHRLLAMLVYRGFAVHQPDHSYRLGSPAGGDVTQAESERLVELCRPHMVRLCAATAESVNLMRRAGPSVVFLEAVESAQVLRVGPVGTRMPARRPSGLSPPQPRPSACFDLAKGPERSLSQPPRGVWATA
jgi:DNA-binding IclR family transcriptional regulator